MCGFTIDLIDFDELTDGQKKNSLEKPAEREKSS